MSTSHFTPTPQQQAAIDAFNTGDSLVLEAGAGTGKTSTLKLLGREAEQRNRQGLYLCFNKAIQVEASKSFPSNVACKTAHSLAWGAIMNKRGTNYRTRLNAKRLYGNDLAKAVGSTRIFKIGQDDELNQRNIAYLVIEAIDRFCRSDSSTVEYWHAPKIPSATETQEKEIRNHVAGLASKVWDDIAAPQGSFPWGKKGHGYYLKLFQLSDPVLRYDFILFDEAQDANPVMAAIVMSQSCQKVLVGDRNQAIYGWNGAVDAMENFDAKHRLPLTQSFRFGPAIADEGNKFLAALDSKINDQDFRIQGFDKIDSTVEPIESPRAILCRTNGGVLEQAMKFHSEGKKVAIVGGAADLKSFAYGALKLMRGEETDHPDLAGFANWQEVVEYAGTDEGKDIAMLVKLTTQYGPGSIIEIANNSVNENEADVVVSTAHKAKGREWETVLIAGDFQPKTNKETGELTITKADLMLAYVAVTRAIKTLHNVGLAWINEEAFLAASAE